MQLEPVLFAPFEKNRTEVVAGELGEYQGKTYAHIRVFKASINGFLRTSKGVSLPMERVSELTQGIRKLADILGPNRLVAKVELGKMQIRIGSRLFNDQMYLDVREFFQHGEEWLPSKKGVMIRPELLDRLIALADELESSANGECVEDRA